MKLSELERYNRENEEPLKNARNAAAGAIRNINIEETRKRHLSVFFYQVGYCDPQPDFNNADDMLTWLKSQGFVITPKSVPCENIEDVINAINAIGEERDSLDFLIDGAVVKVTDFRTRSYLGNTDRFPRWAIAWKYAAEEEITQINEVTWEIGRTGRVTPLAHVSPIDLAGATVKKATLNNVEDIRRKKLKLHCNVLIRRSNDVIPEIMGVVEGSTEGEEILPPEVCPACGAVLEQTGPLLNCVNSLSCPPQLISRIVHYGSRNAMDIEMFSDKTAEQLYNVLNVRAISDLYRLKAEDLSKLDGFGEKKINKLLEEIEKSKTKELARFLFAIGIPQVGRKTAEDIANALGSLDAVLNATAEDFYSIEGIGEIIADNIVKFFKDEHIRGSIDDLRKLGVSPSETIAETTELPLKGNVYVLTGSLEKYTRDEATTLLEKLGARVSGSVSKKTTAVFAGEKAGSKLSKAEALGVPVFDEDELERLLTSYGF